EQIREFGGHCDAERFFERNLSRGRYGLFPKENTEIKKSGGHTRMIEVNSRNILYLLSHFGYFFTRDRLGKLRLCFRAFLAHFFLIGVRTAASIELVRSTGREPHLAPPGRLVAQGHRTNEDKQELRQ